MRTREARLEGGGFQRDRDRFGDYSRGRGEYGGGGQYGRAERQHGSSFGQRDNNDDDYIGLQGYNEQEGWFRGQGMRDDDRVEYGGRYGRQSRAGATSSRGRGYSGQPGEPRDYAHGGLGGDQSGLGGLGRPSGEGFFRRAPVGQWSDDLGGPHGGRGPEGYKRGDDRIKEDLCDQLTQHSYLDASGIRVEVKDGEVTLSGTVQSREEKRLAEDLAESARGVGEVRNDLRIKAQGRTGEFGSRHTIGTPHGNEPHAGGDAEKEKQQGDQRANK